MARALIIGGWMTGFGDVEQGAALIERAMEAARDSGDEWAMAYATRTLGHQRMLRTDHLAVALMRQARSAAERIGDQTLLLETRLWEGHILAMLGEGRAAHGVLDGVFEQFQELGNTFLGAVAAGDAGLAAAVCGDDHRARELTERALDLAGGHASPALSVPLLAYRGLVGWLAGDLTNAEAAFREAIAIGFPPALSWLSDTHTAALAAVLVAGGRGDDAREVLDQLRAAVPQTIAMTWSTIARARLAVADGALDTAEDLAHEALEHAIHAHDVMTSADAFEVLAALRAQTSPRDSTRLIGAAQRLRDETGCMRRRGDAGDHRHLLERLADALGEDAYQTALAEGASMELEAAASWVTRARGRRGRPLAGWASLTPTEAKVANLVVEGLTNAQIGERLLIGTGTVKTHLAHVFNKLGLASRAQLAAAVTRHRQPTS